MRLQEFLKQAQTNNWKVKFYKFQAGKPYRETYWKIKETGEINIVLDIKAESVHKALKHVSVFFLNTS